MKSLQELEDRLNNSPIIKEVEKIDEQIRIAYKDMQENHIFGRPKIFLEKNVCKMIRQSIGVYLGFPSVREIPNTYMGMKVAGTFESDICNFIIMADDLSEEEKLSNYSNEDLLKELLKREED